ncbi:AMP-binding protein [Pseudodesulfovibrio sp. JC047]|uniref:amino acid adenylation domain-containing protein n=1 Tax=Pseudodesulfovibrio sp. JC047 TaxID=2683199 RepID=UPI0013D0906A|nr:amino acid adenylation domain-containing protein [Pseudodesulfovibrio sp. JC047]NDV20636.1 AMP-binding protein [Pseudodesulfovibrio sp. JC047]
MDGVAMMLPERFAHTVRTVEDAPAIITPTQTYSFAALHHRATQTAAALAEQGIGPGHRVAIRMTRGFDFLACMVGVMLSGAAYTPLDAHLPTPYIATILTQLSPDLTVIEPGIPAIGNGPTCLFDDLASDRPFQAIPPQKDAPAYIIFTSGSTGIPKGVVISHGALSHFTDWCLTEFRPYARKPLLNVANFSFDQSVLDIVMLLAAGSPMVCLPGAPTIMDIVGAMNRHAVAFVSTVPSTFSILLSAGAILRRFPLDHLECVVLGGAAFPESTRHQLFDWKPSLDVYNLYGPTEATVYCLFQKVTVETRSPHPTVALGVPFPEMHAHLIDRDDSLLTNAPADGELVLEGPQLMTEYHGSPQATQTATTVTTPELRNRRVYRTGDMVHRDAHGTLFFAGRGDDTVKTRGYRVSLLSLEHAAHAVPGVLEASAIAIPDPAVENRLVLCVTMIPKTDISTHTISEHLKNALPSYMLPKDILTFDALPKNTSGKIDKKRLIRHAMKDTQ